MSSKIVLFELLLCDILGFLAAHRFFAAKDKETKIIQQEQKSPAPSFSVSSAPVTLKVQENAQFGENPKPVRISFVDNL